MGQPATGYRRVVLKLSGEALMGSKAYGIDVSRVHAIAGQIHAALQTPHRKPVEIGIVVGAGNFYRGAEQASDLVPRSTADYIGMLMTVPNAIVLQAALEKLGVHTRVQSAMTLPELAEPYIRRRGIRHLEKDRVVIFAAGTGNPYFTTDSAAALRALEMHADVLLMAKNGVKGIYSADPHAHPDAEFIGEITHQDALHRNLKVMDSNAFALCKDNKLPIMVFDMDTPENLTRALAGERIGTLVSTP